MALQWSKSKIFMFYIALILTNIIIMNDLVIVPIINDLYMAFPDSPMGVSTIVSVPGIITIFAALFVPLIMKKFSHRTLILGCAAVFCVASIFGCAIENVNYMILCRVFCGFCYAIINVVYVALVADVFVDSKKRARFMGIFNGMMSLIGAAMSMASGILATSGGWQNSYKVYWCAIPMLILLIFFIPRPSDIRQTDSEEAEQEMGGEAQSGEVRKGFGSRFVILMIGFFFFNLCYGSFSNFVSVYAAENALGDQAFAGSMSSVATITSAVACFFFGYTYSKLKGKFAIPCYGIFLVGLLMAYGFRTPTVALITAACAGIAYGTFLTFAYTHCVEIVSPDKIEMSIGIITAVSCCGLALSAYLVPWLMSIRQGLYSPNLILLAACIAVFAVIESISAFKETKAAKA